MLYNDSRAKRVNIINILGHKIKIQGSVVLIHLADFSNMRINKTSQACQSKRTSSRREWRGSQIS